MDNTSRTRRAKKLVTGVAWYRPEQWSRLLEISSDADGLDTTYEDWLRNATAHFTKLTAAGFTLERVDVDVERLLAWCAIQGRPVDAKARSAYAAHLLSEAYWARKR